MRGRTCLLMMSLALAGACGGGSGDGGGGGGNFSSGLPATKKVTELSGSENKSFCEAAERTATSATFEGPTCKLLAVFGASLAAAGGGDPKAACRTAYDECLKQDLGKDEIQNCEMPPANCTATIGELETCFNDMLQALETLASNLPACDKLTMESLANLDGGSLELTEPASCKAFNEKCPGYLDGLGGVDGDE